ncbi:hypothetical protein PHMEG_0004311 [Phytophthora megakarya]|uniref:RxLR effector protein n=1 Tax=Phytophthora megakarya TaxID=4795 RepID=A0A225WU78_9STRA|nr:hypothetical protein PHMEG_0004311 [Phytophthora megakarya]
MQLIKGLFIAAVVCVASVSAQHKQWVDPYPPGADSDDSGSTTPTPTPTPGPVEKGFNVHQVNFASSDPKQEKDEEKESSGNSTVYVVGALGACACVGVMAAVYMKRRNDEDKLPGEIFTIDDKNSVL